MAAAEPLKNYKWIIGTFPKLSQEIKLVQKCGAALTIELLVDNEGLSAFGDPLCSFDTLCNCHSHRVGLVV